MSTIAAQIRELRLAKGYTIQEMADALGVDRKTAYNWEAGRTMPPADQFMAIFGLPMRQGLRKARTGPRVRSKS
jgi:transcriptional regulator with XRE-family HTH domain